MERHTHLPEHDENLITDDPGAFEGHAPVPPVPPVVEEEGLPHRNPGHLHSHAGDHAYGPSGD